MTICKVCGFNYSGDYLPDRKEHEKYHKSFLNALERYGPRVIIADWRKWEALKCDGLKMQLDKNNTLSVRVKGAEMRFIAWFNRSLAAINWNIARHPSFEDYMAMRLNYTDTLERIIDNVEIAKELVKRYGRKPSNAKNGYIGSGYSYWEPKPVYEPLRYKGIC